MNDRLINRRGSLFIINEALLPKGHNIDMLKATLYTVIAYEFRGAVTNKKYKHLTPLKKINAINDYALKWLKDNGYATR